MNRDDSLPERAKMGIWKREREMEKKKERNTRKRKKRKDTNSEWKKHWRE